MEDKKMPLENIVIIGELPLAKNDKERLRYSMGNFIPSLEGISTEHTIITGKPPHGNIILDYIDYINKHRREKGIPPLTLDQEKVIRENTVPLIIRENCVFIRPDDPEKIELAFIADEALQQIGIPKNNVKFLRALDESVRTAIKKRGECWRINPLPMTKEDVDKEITNSRVSINTPVVYYYNMRSGTRELTYEEFSKLGNLSDSELAKSLHEIKIYSSKLNESENPEIEFFMANESINSSCFSKDYLNMDSSSLREAYLKLKEKFRNAVDKEYLKDDLKSELWKDAMHRALIRTGSSELDEVPEAAVLGLCPEYSMRIKWLPGARITKHGEIIFDSIFDEKESHPELNELCDDKVKSFIFNYVRENDQIEYINIGKIIESATTNPKIEGRREVYFIVMKILKEAEERKEVSRLQEWGVKERLDQGRDMQTAVSESEEYSEFISDTILGCRQLGLNIPSYRIGKVNEIYRGENKRYNGAVIHTIYRTRRYVDGFATDKIPQSRYENPLYLMKFMQLMGKSAALNMIVGKKDEHSGEVMFDKGGEIVMDTHGKEEMPKDIAFVDSTGFFVDCSTPLIEFAKDYEEPIYKRKNFLQNNPYAIMMYIESFKETALEVQKSYRKGNKRFDRMFDDRVYDSTNGGSFRYRWEKVLKRLDSTNFIDIANKIKKDIGV